MMGLEGYKGFPEKQLIICHIFVYVHWFLAELWVRVQSIPRHTINKDIKNCHACMTRGMTIIVKRGNALASEMA